jgi:hypothetical protein
VLACGTSYNLNVYQSHLGSYILKVTAAQAWLGLSKQAHNRGTGGHVIHISHYAWIIHVCLLDVVVGGQQRAQLTGRHEARESTHGGLQFCELQQQQVPMLL